MRAEGDIANLITSVAIWRRIGIIGEETSGVVLMGLTTTGNGLPGPSEPVARASIRSRSPWPRIREVGSNLHHLSRKGEPGFGQLVEARPNERFLLCERGRSPASDVCSARFRCRTIICRCCIFEESIPEVPLKCYENRDKPDKNGTPKGLQRGAGP